MRFYCLKKSTFYLPEQVHHQMVDRFCIPLPPPTDMGSIAYTQARAHVATAAARERSLGYFFDGVEHEEYQNWFHLVGKPLLFPEVLRETQRGMSVTIPKFGSSMHDAKARVHRLELGSLLAVGPEEEYTTRKRWKRRKREDKTNLSHHCVY